LGRVRAATVPLVTVATSFLGPGHLEDVLRCFTSAQFQPGPGLRAVAGEELLGPGMPGVGWLVPELGDGLGVKNVQHDQFGTTAEEMETASAAQIAGLFQIPFLGIRVVSNNITNGEAYDTRTGEACQDYVYDVVKAYIAGRAKGR